MHLLVKLPHASNGLSVCTAGREVDAMLSRDSQLAVLALALLILAPETNHAQLLHQAAAPNVTLTAASVVADLWHATSHRQHIRNRGAGSRSRRVAVREKLSRILAGHSRWRSTAHGVGRHRVADRFLAETQQNASQPSLEQEYAAVTQQLQAKAALLQSYASQAAAVTQARYGSFARTAQVQLQQGPTGESAVHGSGCMLMDALRYCEITDASWCTPFPFLCCRDILLPTSRHACYSGYSMLAEQRFRRWQARRQWSSARRLHPGGPRLRLRRRRRRWRSVATAAATLASRAATARRTAATGTERHASGLVSCTPYGAC